MILLGQTRLKNSIHHKTFCSLTLLPKAKEVNTNNEVTILNNIPNL